MIVGLCEMPLASPAEISFFVSLMNPSKFCVDDLFGLESKFFFVLVVVFM